MHNAAFAALGLNWVYLAFDVRPQALRVALQGLPALGFCGVNLTVPHKEAALKFLDWVADEAEVIAAVNTVVVREGKLCGYNTDGAGFLAALAEAGVEVHGRRVLLFGAGGAARAVGVALVRQGAAAVWVANRTLSRALGLADDLAKLGKETEVEALPLSGEALAAGMSAADIVVNATSLGLRPEDRFPVDAGWFAAGKVAVDLIYNPPVTDFIRKAEAGGARVVDGLGMLVHQGALAFELWTGMKPPIEVMREAAQKALWREKS